MLTRNHNKIINEILMGTIEEEVVEEELTVEEDEDEEDRIHQTLICQG